VARQGAVAVTVHWRQRDSNYEVIAVDVEQIIGFGKFVGHKNFMKIAISNIHDKLIFPSYLFQTVQLWLFVAPSLQR
jgi:hypothetical protein